MTAELEELLSSSFKLRKALQQVLPPEAIEYILELIAKDKAHQNFIRITEENET
jgi:hypothetical protein